MYSCIKKYFQEGKGIVLIFTYNKSLLRLKKSREALNEVRREPKSSKYVNILQCKETQKILILQIFNFTKPKSNPSISHLQ